MPPLLIACPTASFLPPAFPGRVGVYSVTQSQVSRQPSPHRVSVWGTDHRILPSPSDRATPRVRCPPDRARRQLVGECQPCRHGAPRP
ncbi:hypothetical protein FKM82_022849 [Ascaphus truei]